MKLKEFNLPKNLWYAFRDFYRENGVDKSSSLAFYAILSSLFLLTFFIFLVSKILGNPDVVLKSLYPFSPEFFNQISPDIFKRAQEISLKLKNIGFIGFLFTFFLGFLIFKKIVQFVNEMFYIKLQRGFLTRRISEFGLLFIIAMLVILSFVFTGIISTVTTLFSNNEFVASHINPGFIELINSFFIRYLIPFLVTLSFFFILYKWIPEIKVHVKSAFISALFCTVIWEIVKRAYAFYLGNISFFGQIKGPILAVILYGFWMELSLGIMLYGAKLTYILDKERNEQYPTN